jgi:hypothetical protein
MFNVTEERVPPRACQPRGRVWNWPQLWTALSPTTRQSVLQTLSRVVAQQLPTPKTGQEVLHEHG